MRPASHPLLAVAARFAVVFAVLAAPWPGLAHAYTDAVGSIATALADPLLSATNVSFTLRSPAPQEHLPEWRGVIQVKQDLPEGPVRNAGAIDLRRSGYLQLVTFLCLAAAWPAAWRRRKLAAATVAFAVVAATTGASVLDYLVQIGAVQPGAGGATALALVRRALVAAPGMAYAVPALAWVGVVTRPESVPALLRAS
jgi:hypothetical protein